MTLSIHTGLHGVHPCLSIKGSCNQRDLEPLVRAFKEILPKVRHSLYLRLSEVPYMDSAALGVLISNFNDLLRQNRRLVILEPSKEVRRLLSTTSLDKIVPIE